MGRASPYLPPVWRQRSFIYLEKGIHAVANLFKREGLEFFTPHEVWQMLKTGEWWEDDERKGCGPSRALGRGFRKWVPTADGVGVTIIYPITLHWVQIAPDLTMNRLKIFYFIMVQKQYACSRNHMLSFSLFLGEWYVSRLCCDSGLQLPVNYVMGMRANNRYTYTILYSCSHSFTFSTYSRNYIRYSTFSYKTVFVLDDFAQLQVNESIWTCFR